ncbi:MAG: MoaD family protein [Parabacteroides sp.]|nr:MoaD family protein [Eubacteriales bacterium]MDD4591116.1 MoaD family protein [Parabacteroides sp.]
MTIRIRLKYFGSFREITEIFEEIVMLNNNAILNDLFLILISRYGKRMRTYILSDDLKIPPLINVMVNGHNVAKDKGADTVLQNDDLVLLMPHISGG